MMRKLSLVAAALALMAPIAATQAQNTQVTISGSDWH